MQTQKNPRDIRLINSIPFYRPSLSKERNDAEKKIQKENNGKIQLVNLYYVPLHWTILLVSYFYNLTIQYEMDDNKINIFCP